MYSINSARLSGYAHLHALSRHAGYVKHSFTQRPRTCPTQASYSVLVARCWLLVASTDATTLILVKCCLQQPPAAANNFNKFAALADFVELCSDSRRETVARAMRILFT